MICEAVSARSSRGLSTMKKRPVLPVLAPPVLPVNEPKPATSGSRSSTAPNYGPIDVAFFDGDPYQLRDLAWKLQLDVIVTRGAIETPELYVPGIPIPGAWEANFTMGTAWQYQPQNEVYKTGGQVIDILVETRAKGGNLLLNIGPKPDGELAIEQEERLREVALWMQVNQECIYGVRPWVITVEVMSDDLLAKGLDVTAKTVFAAAREVLDASG